MFLLLIEKSFFYKELFLNIVYPYFLFFKVEDKSTSEMVSKKVEMTYNRKMNEAIFFSPINMIFII